MPDPDAERQAARRPYCHHCADLIGVYEPMVLDTHAGPRITSLAAEPWLYDTEQPCFHHACYELVKRSER